MNMFLDMHTSHFYCIGHEALFLADASQLEASSLQNIQGIPHEEWSYPVQLCYIA